MYVVNHDVVHIGDTSNLQTAIMEAWRTRYPGAYPFSGSVGWLGWPLAEGVRMALSHQMHFVTGAGQILGFLLANVPAIWLLVKSTPVDRCSSPIFLIGAASAFLVMLTTFAVGADWGRYSYLFGLHAFLFVLMTRSQKMSKINLSPLAIVALCVYAVAWQPTAFAPGGTWPLLPGHLLKQGYNFLWETFEYANEINFENWKK
jgi:hypothetical protein